MKQLIFLILISSSLCTYTWKTNYCESWSCQQSFNECWMPSCGFLRYSSNPDFFTYFFRRRVNKYSLNGSYWKKFYAKMGKSTKRKIKGFKKQLKEIRSHRKRLRAFLKDQRKLWRKKMRQSLKNMNKGKYEVVKGYRGFSKCGHDFKCFGTVENFFVTSEGGNKTHVRRERIEGRSDNSSYSYEKTEAKSGDFMEMDFNDDFEKDMQSSGFSDDGQEMESPNMEEIDNNDDNAMNELMKEFEEGKDVMKVIRYNANRHIGALSLFLRNIHDDDMRSYLFYGDSVDCFGSCLSNYSGIYVIWIGLLTRLRKFYKHRIVRISGCSKRRSVLRNMFTRWCEPLPELIRVDLIRYYDYVFTWDGCSPLVW